MDTIEELQNWQDGINKILMGDCLKLMSKMPDKCVDLCLTDPPYGTTSLNWDKKINLTRLWKNLLRVGKENCVFIFTSSQPFTTELINSNENFKYELIWEKDRPTGLFTAKIQPMKAHENILVFGKGKIKYNPQKWEGEMESHKRGRSTAQSEHYKNSKFSQETAGTSKYPRSVLFFKKEIPSFHPTAKPVALFNYLIKTYSDKNDLIFDPFMGSWTTARACMNLGRNFIGAELSAEYCAVGRNRLKQQVLI